MVSESRQRLNQRLCQNWKNMETANLMKSSNMSSNDEDVSDCELTNLSWLVGLDLDCLTSDSNTGNGGFSNQSSMEYEELKTRSDGDGDWKMRPRKPTHTYSSMITMAINETPDKQITVAGIYNWIRNNFSYYRQTSASWKNSVRHCLSTNKRFQRVPQSRDKLGKRFWRIVPDVSSQKQNNLPTYRPLSKKRCNDGGIRQAIRVIGRCETIESTGESQGSDSFTESVDESVDESIDGSSLTDPGSPSLPSNLLNSSWSCDSRLNDILNDLKSNPTLNSGLEPCAFEQVSENTICQRILNLDNDFLISDATGNEDWTLIDISRSSGSRPLGEYFQSNCHEEFNNYLLDSDLNLKAIISEF